MSQMPSTTNSSGASYFFRGFSLIHLKGIKRFIFIPLLINLVLFSVAFYFAVQEIEYYMAIAESWLPDWLTWLSNILWPLIVISILVIFSFIFSTAANWLAAPFNGMLSEKVELLLTDKKIPDTTMDELIKDIPRTLGREVQKFLYYLPKAILFFLIFLFLPIIGQIIWFIFIAWMMAIQYKDYPFDNHKIPFDIMTATLKKNQGLSYSFGATTMLFAMLPLVNLIVMPVAICGATLLWVEQYRDDFID